MSISSSAACVPSLVVTHEVSLFFRYPVKPLGVMPSSCGFSDITPEKSCHQGERLWAGSRVPLESIPLETRIGDTRNRPESTDEHS
jgi:hypothetical protein